MLKKRAADFQTVGKYLVKWLVLTAILGVLMGCLSAFFLLSLNWVTALRSAHGWLILFLPVSGAVFAWLYQKYGGNALRGNNLVIEQGNGAQERIPLRLIPLTLFGTITTHLFGGSVGREGTAVQMGGALADWLNRVFKISGRDREVLIMAGISAGFSSVFGTPLAGTVFALEVLTIGKMRNEALIPSFLAAFFANLVTEAFPVSHGHYLMGALPDWSFSLFWKLAAAGICFGWLSRLFSSSIGYLKSCYQRLFTNSSLRIFFGGSVVVLAALLLGSRYLGLSLPLLEAAFAGEAHWYDFIGKLFFTVLSLGAGYQGGEVTPLFEIGATAGAALAGILQLSVPFLAALGFIGVFAGATNTPIACAIMGIELFGGEGAVFFFFICIISFATSGNQGIYSAQQKLAEKGRWSLAELKADKPDLK